MTSADARTAVGQLVDGRYRVRAILADGGMATVYEARDEHLDRPVALKVMRPDLARNEEFVRRFHREARSAARLNHPHVVSVHDQGSDDDHVYLVMELVEGHTLRETIRDQAPMSAREALRTLQPVLLALSAAHDAGLIHRDVKPENVLIAQDGTTKVADFGLARAVATTSLGRSDMLLGTAAYLAPEQVTQGVADERSDVYACGLILFELLTGQKAFPGENPIHVAYQHVHGPTPAPSSLASHVPSQLDDLIAVTCSRDPLDRPDHAGDLLEKVEALIADPAPELDVEPEPPEHPHDDGDTRTARVPRVRTRELPRHDDDTEPTRSGVPPMVMLVVALAVVALVGIVSTLALLGPRESTIPLVTGLNEAAAHQALTDAGITVGEVRRQHDVDVPTGQAIGTDPSNGVNVPRSDSVDLVISTGPRPLRVPPLTGLTVDEARTTLDEAGLRVIVAEKGVYSDEIAPGRIAQYLPATSAPDGGTVVVTPSRGTAPAEVPDVTGLRYSSAAKRLTDAGFEPVRANGTFPFTGIVTAQTLPAGASAPKGTPIVLTVG